MFWIHTISTPDKYNQWGGEISAIILTDEAAAEYVIACKLVGVKIMQTNVYNIPTFNLLRRATSSFLSAYLTRLSKDFHLLTNL